MSTIRPWGTRAPYSDRMTTTGVRLAGLALGAALLLTGCAAGGGGGGASGSASATGSTPAPSATVAPVVADDLAQGVDPSPVDVEVGGPAQVNVRELTIQPGAGTGKHCHYGQLIAVVEQGTFTHYAPVYPTGVHVYHAGDVIIEGPGYVHEGKNEGDTPVVLMVTYVTPQGDPLAETDLSKCTG